MRKIPLLVVSCLFAATLSDASQAQSGQYNNPGHQKQAERQQQQHPSGQYYYNGRWVDQNEWQRHSNERDQWAQTYQQRHGSYQHSGSHDDSTALIAGILGFALGAAIVGSQQQAEHARTADQNWDSYCAGKYHSYDRHSRTYLGVDGLRHYCQ